MATAYTKPSPNKTLFYVIRHGETAYNLEGRMQGQKDICLTEKGELQAQVTASHLASVLGTNAINKIYSSDLQRAYKTGTLIQERLAPGITVETRTELREMHFGSLVEGLLKKERKERFPDVEKNVFHKGDIYYKVPPDGESLYDKYTRTVSVFNEIATNNTGQTVLVTTHGGVIDSLYRYVSRIAINERKGNYTPDNCSITVLECEVVEGVFAWKCLDFNNSVHLVTSDLTSEATGTTIHF